MLSTKILRTSVSFLNSATGMLKVKNRLFITGQRDHPKRKELKILRVALALASPLLDHPAVKPTS